MMIISSHSFVRNHCVGSFSGHGRDIRQDYMGVFFSVEQARCSARHMQAASESASSMTPSHVNVKYSTRLGTDEDVELFGLWMNTNREYHSAYNGETRTSQLKFKKGSGLQALVPNLPNARVIFLLRNNDPDPVGFCSFNIQYTGLGTPPVLYLQDIFIGEDCRGSGAGRFLMKELENLANKSFCSHMTWNADRRNTPAVDFYERLGAQITGFTGNWIHMRLSL